MSSQRGFQGGLQAGYELEKLLDKDADINASCRKIWKVINTDGDEKIDFEELKIWALEHKIFGSVDDSDTLFYLNKLFDDIDKDGSGTLDFQEFSAYLKLVQQEKLELKLAEKHHLMQLPASLLGFKEKEWSIDGIEKELFEKLEQHTAKDTDRYRHIVSMIRNQIQKSQGIDIGDANLYLTKFNFNKLLAWLGLFATRAQAEALFDRYDVDGDGSLTLHEFLTRCRPADYPVAGQVNNPLRSAKRVMGGDIDGERYYDLSTKPQGKKQYHHGPPQPIVPSNRIYGLSVGNLCSMIRKRMEMKTASGHAASLPLRRRNLAREFEYFDVTNTGVVGSQHLRRVCEILGLVLSDTHYGQLLEKHGLEVEGIRLFKYRDFILDCYPSKTPLISTSLKRADDVRHLQRLELQEQKRAAKMVYYAKKKEQEEAKEEDVQPRPFTSIDPQPIPPLSMPLEMPESLKRHTKTSRGRRLHTADGFRNGSQTARTSRRINTAWFTGTYGGNTNRSSLPSVYPPPRGFSRTGQWSFY